MDVREKLVEQAISHFWYGVSHDIFSEPVKTYAKLAIEALEKENGVTVQEWISTDKRTPTQEDAPTEYVFTAYKNENCYDVNISLWDTVVGCPNLYDYWMPLPMPQPPKGE